MLFDVIIIRDHGKHGAIFKRLLTHNMRYTFQGIHALLETVGTSLHSFLISVVDDGC